MASRDEIEIQLEALLGKGGFGKVYRGTWKQCDRTLQAAIKSIKIEDPMTFSEQEFQREIVILVQLNHLHIVSFIGYTTVDTTKYIAMELCDGTLKQYVENELTSIPKGSVEDKYLVGQIIVGLSYLHSKRIIHKDLKPDNVLLWRSGIGLFLAKLADFGFSRQLALGKMTFDDTTHLGTSGFIAPELWQAEKSIPTFASDIWALGVVLFFIVSDGQHPYGERILKTQDFDVRDMLIRKMKAPPNVVDIESTNWAAVDLILCMIDKNPDNRPNIQNVFIHPYFSLMNEATKNLFLLNVHNIFRGDGYKSMMEFYSESSIQSWFDNLDPQMKRHDIREDLELIQPILRNMKKSGNELAEKLERIANSHVTPAGHARKQVIDGEKNMIGQHDVLTIYNSRLEILRRLLEAGPRLTTTYTWSHLQSTYKLQKESCDVLLDDVLYSMSFLSPAMFEELIGLKLQRVEECDRQPHLDEWFHFACFLNLPEIAMTLIGIGAQVNSTRSGGGTGLHAAMVNKSSAQFVENLLEVGANPSLATDDGMTALHFAAVTCGDAEVVQLILNACRKIDENCLQWQTCFTGITAKQLAICNPNPAILKFFENVKTQEHLPLELDPNLMIVMSRDIEKLQRYINDGANVNKVGPSGSTPLNVISAMDGTRQIVEILLKAGADPNIKDEDGKTALHCAVLGANTEVAQLLLENPYIKADANVKMSDGRTCLHIVTSGQAMRMDDFFQILETSPLKQAFASIMRQNFDAGAFRERVFHPFHAEAENIVAPPFAFGDKHVEMIKILVTAGAHLDSRDNDGNSPLHCASANSPNVETIITLLELKADPKACDNEGYTPLECAAHQNPCPEVTQELWLVTIDDATPQATKISIAELAEENENPEVRELILALMGL